MIPHIDSFDENGYTKEEMKVTNETRKIFGTTITRAPAPPPCPAPPRALVLQLHRLQSCAKVAAQRAEAIAAPSKGVCRGQARGLASSSCTTSLASP